MRAVRLHDQAPIAARPLVLEDCRAPVPEAGELRLTVRACGVCHTDLHVVEGDLPLARRPLIPGHQIVGVIDAVGAGVGDGRLGERVGVTWLASACGRCPRCCAGTENLCEEARFTGYDVDGGFAEQVVVAEPAAHPLPEAFSDTEAAPLLCAGIIGYRSLRLSGLTPGGRLGLYGFGASAHLAIQVATYWGCEVFVFTRASHHRAMAARLGASWVGGARDQAPAKLDAAITFAPAGWIVREALRAVRPGGTVAVNAIHLSDIPELDYREHLYGEKTLRSITNLTRTDATEFLEIAARVPVAAAVETFALDDANEVLRALKESRLDGAAVLVP